MIIEYTIEADYTAEQMYALVADYHSYPEFIKYCSKAITTQQGNNEVLAQLEMSIAGFTQSFSTFTKFYPFHKITMDLADGPFQKLKGYWEFQALDSVDSKQPKTRISLYMDYEMNSFLEFLFGPKFRKAMVGMVDCFIERAALKYKE